MALVPRMFRPSVVIRRKAMYAGFLGPSRMWKVVGVVVFGRSSLKKFFGKQPQVIDTSRLGSGRVMELATARPMTRKHAKELRAKGIEPVTIKEHKAMSQLWANERAAERAAASKKARKRDRKAERRAAKAAAPAT